MSAIRVRSSRLRSRALVVAACHSAGRSLTRACRSSRCGQRWGGCRGWPQRGLGLGEGGQLGFPAGLQGAGDEPVLRFGGVEGPFGAVGVVAGAFDGQLGGAAGAGAAVGDLVGGGERERDLVGVQRGQQPLGDDVVDRAALTERQVGVACWSLREWHS